MTPYEDDTTVTGWVDSGAGEAAAGDAAAGEAAGIDPGHGVEGPSGGVHATGGTGAEGAGTVDSGAVDAAGADPDRARLLFRYVGGDEWREYRRVLKVFAGTFFAEFTPAEVAELTGIEVDIVAGRLESLRGWGNLTVSSSVGNPTSLDDYYRRRNRYLITRQGQEVHELVERVLTTVDEFGEVQAGRLRDLRQALKRLIGHLDAGVSFGSTDLADASRQVFDIHDRFTTDLAQFFAQLNQWQSRYDLTHDEVHLFASVLVDYVTDELSQIERLSPPIARSLEVIQDRLESLIPAMQSGLALRVEDAGLGDTLQVRRASGTQPQDWQHLSAWFLSAPGRPSRLQEHTRQALAAVRTLTANVSRLARLGVGTASKRSDFVRLAGFFDGASAAEQAHEIAFAAFGMGSTRRIGAQASDADDPEPTTTPWRDAPKAAVPVSLRERGDTTARGRASPVRDRQIELDELKRRRDRQRVLRQRTAEELLASADIDGLIDGAELSSQSFSMLRDLIGRSSHSARPGAPDRYATDSGVRCEIRRVDGSRTVVRAPEGCLTLIGLQVRIEPADSEEAA